MVKANKKTASLGAVLLVVMLAIGIYANCLSNGFVYDDSATVEDSVMIRRWQNLPALFSRDYFLLSGETTYRPVVTCSYFADYFLWKLKPSGYHLSNLLLHAANGVLVYFLMRHIFRKSVFALACVLLFVSHPVTTEAVNAVSYREDLLAFFFFALSFLAYLKLSSRSRRIGYTIFCLSSFFLALFSKEMAAALPLLALFYEICFHRDLPAAIKGKLPVYCGLFAVLGGYLVVRFVLFKNPGAPPLETVALYPRLLTMGRVIIFYLRLLAFPLRLSAEYVYPVSSSLREPKVFFSLAGVLAILAVTVFNLRRAPDYAFAAGWFLLTILPVANVFPLHNMVAERYLYLPLVGFCLALTLGGQGVYRRLKTRARYAVPGLLILLIGLYSFRTAIRNRDWKDRLTFSLKTLATCPESARFHNNLGVAYQDLGRYKEAIKEHQAAVRMKSDFAQAHANLGMAYKKTSRLEDAISEYQLALKINPSSAKAHDDLGVAYMEKGLLDEAVREHQLALALNPYSVAAHNNLGVTFAQRKEFARARAQWEKALALDPSVKEIQDNLRKLEQMGF